MKRTAFFFSSILVMTTGTALANPSGLHPKQAMFNTKKEASAAAPGFGCKGAHQMGSMWMVCSKHEEARQHGVHPKQAMFNTKKEASAAAPGFGCKGAHQMGSMWMVCSKHEEAEQHGHH